MKNIPNLTEGMVLSLFSKVYRHLPMKYGSQKLSILIFHRVLNEVDQLMPTEVCKNEFQWQMSILNKYFNVISLSTGLMLLKKGKLPQNSVAITFDDGYKDNYTNAMPILKKFKFSATFFVATGFLNGGMMWNDKVRELIRYFPDNGIDLNKFGLDYYKWETEEQKRFVIESLISKLKYYPHDERLDKIDAMLDLYQKEKMPSLMMTDSEVRGLFDGGMDIGGHTVSHPILATLKPKKALKEIVDNKEYLENIISEKLKIFAYPNGRPTQDYTSESVEAVKKSGYNNAVTTSWGVSHKESDDYQLPRFTPWDKNSIKYMARLFQNVFNKSGVL